MSLFITKTRFCMRMPLYPLSSRMLLVRDPDMLAECHARLYIHDLSQIRLCEHRQPISRHTRSRRVWPSYKVRNGLQSSSRYQLQGRARLKCKAISRNIDLHDLRCS